MLEERRAAKRASATPWDELEEYDMNGNAEKSAEAMVVAVEAVLTETRETFWSAHSLNSLTGSCCEPPCRYDGREFLFKLTKT